MAGGISFEQLRASSTLANAGLQAYTDGSLGAESIRVAVADGISRGASGITVDPTGTVAFTSAAWSFGASASLDVSGATFSGTNVPNADWVSSQIATGVNWGYPVLHVDQLDSTNDAIRQAVAFYIDGQPVSGDNLIVSDGSTVRTYQFASGGDVTVAIGSDADDSMANLAAAITGDGSGDWDAVVATALDSINSGSGTSTAGTVIVIYRATQIASQADRIYTSQWTTAADPRYVNLSGEDDYSKTSNSQLSVDPTVKTFGPGKLTAELKPGEAHVELDADSQYVWDADSATWTQISGTGAITAGAGLTKSGNTINVNSGEGTANGITVSADAIAVALEAAGSGTGGLSFDSNEIRVNIEANGVGAGGLDLVAGGLAVDPGLGIELAAAGVQVDLEAAGGGVGGLVFNSNEIRVNVESGGATAGGLELVAGGLAVVVQSAGSGTGGILQSASGLYVDVSTGLELLAGGVTVDLEAAGSGTGGLSFDSNEIRVTAGNGIELTAGGVAVDPDSTGIASIEVSSNGVRVAAAAAGAGLAGGGAAALSVGAGTGIDANANDVAIDVGSTVDFSSSTPVWTFGNETTAEGLFVTGTPVDANHVPNKAYVDNVVAGLTWKDPAVVISLVGNVTVSGLVGNLAALAIEALSPSGGDAYVVTTANGAGTLISAVVGDIWQYQDGAGDWVKIVDAVSSAVPDTTYCLLSTSETLIAPFTAVTDDGKRALYDGTGNLIADITLFSPTAGDAYVVEGKAAVSDDFAGNLVEWSGTNWVILVTGASDFVPVDTRAVLGITPAIVLIAPYTEATDDGKIVDFTGASNTGVGTGDATNTAALLIQDPSHIGVFDNDGFTFEGSVPTGSWIQFTGGAGINAGTGLTKSGNTINAIAADDTITMGADDFGVNLDGTDGCIVLDGANGIAIALETAGSGTGGLAIDNNEIRVDVGLGLELLAGGVTVDLEAAGSGTGGLAFDSNEIRVNIETAGVGAGGLELVAGGLAVDPGAGIELLATGVAVDLEANGSGSGGLRMVGAGAAGEVAVDPSDGINLDSNGVTLAVSTATGAQQYGGLVKSRDTDGSGAGSAGSGFLAIQTDDSTLEVNASNQLIIKALGVDTAEVAAAAVTIAKLGVQFEEMDIAATAFSSADPSIQTGTLTNQPALVDSNGYGYVQCYRNGTADMTKKATGTSMTGLGADQFKINAAGSKVEIGANINGSSNIYRVRYLTAL